MLIARKRLEEHEEAYVRGRTGGLQCVGTQCMLEAHEQCSRSGSVTYFLELSPGERGPSGELDGKSEPEHEP